MRRYKSEGHDSAGRKTGDPARKAFPGNQAVSFTFMPVLFRLIICFFFTGQRRAALKTHIKWIIKKFLNHVAFETDEAGEKL